MPLLTKARIRFHLVVPEGKTEAAERALRVWDQACAINQTIQRGIELDWTWDIEEEGRDE